MSEENTNTDMASDAPIEAPAQEVAVETSTESEAAKPASTTPAPHAALHTTARPRPGMSSRGARSPRVSGAPGATPRPYAGASTPGAAGASSSFRKPYTPREGGAGGRPPRRGGDRGPRKSTFEDRRPEFEQKILSIRRVVRVVSGGRRLSFAVSMIIGDKKGSIGVGTGKSIDTSNAIQKALKNAKKNLVKLKLTKEFSIPYDVDAKYATSRITLMPNRGKGTVAGSAARDILKLGGLKDVTAKFHSGSKNKLNNARATVLALSEFAVKKMPGIEFDKEPVGVEVEIPTTTQVTS